MVANVCQIISTFLVVFGFLPISFAGNLCFKTFPGKGFCVNQGSICPPGSQEFPNLSSGLGCPSLNQKCCVNGGVLGQTAQVDRSQCGQGSLLTTRILNGVAAGPCDWPFVVSIRAKLRNKSGLDYGTSTAHQCAGVLIDRGWVLTSASCVLNAGNTAIEAPNQFVVVAGEYNISGIDIDPRTGGQQEQIIRVERAVIHPSYEYSRRDQIDLNDAQRFNSHSVALIKLAEPIRGQCSGVICLPSQAEADDDCALYDDCVITGWGLTSASFNPAKGALDQLKQGRVRLTSRKGCDLVTKRLNRTATRFQGSICQTPADVVTSGCLSDEGGAIMCSTGKNWVVRGILPYAICITNDQYDLFVTDVAPYLRWIKSVMNFYGTVG